MDHVFCTVLSRTRLYQAIALLCSLHTVKKTFILHILCVDDATYNLLKKMDWDSVHLTRLDELKNDTLDGLRRSRKQNEYCWTLKPIYLEYLFKTYPKIERLTYIDADLFFFSDPEPVFTSQPHSSVLLSKGDIRIPNLDTRDTLTIQRILGKYNSGFISFKRDELGLMALDWWKEKCLDCCISMPEGGRFGDQKYLDELPQIFRNVTEIRTPGVNVGHWNSYYYNYSVYQGRVYADLSPLICYHFSGFRVVKGDRVLMIHEADRTRKPFFYDLYIDILMDVIESIRAIDPAFSGYSGQDDLGTHGLSIMG
jgi:hypothetical protein